MKRSSILFALSAVLAAVLFASVKLTRTQRFLGTTKSPFTFHSTAEEVTEGIDLSGKTYLVTGSNSGIGLETVRVLVLRGATVIATGRTEDKVREATKSLPLGKGGKIVPLECELSSPESVKQFLTKAIKYQYDAIICNAGIMALPKLELVHGLEKQFFTNHMGHFLLVKGLLGSLKDDGRVVMVSSGANDMAPTVGIDFDNLDGSKGYNPLTAYGQSKLANVLMAWELAEQFKGTGKTALSLHPGVISTNLARHVDSWTMTVLRIVMPLFVESSKTIPQGTATQVFAAVHPNAKLANTTYYLVNTQEHLVHPAGNKQLANKLWKFSEDIARKL
ncbi:hypothetical protein BASA81_005864 [Batrachochytrium salamandrivorans]|nr:hypothetical protein BASA81_005864 [Batrachochytrium salamandrivorans]